MEKTTFTETDLKKELGNAYNSSDVQQFKDALKKAQNKYPNVINSYTFKFFNLAILKNNLKMVAELIAARANVNAQNSSGDTPLHCAAEYGTLEMVKTLIEAKANINQINKNNQTPIDVASDKTIADYLTSNTTMVSDLIIFIDYKDEIKPRIISNNLKIALEQKAAPCLIFGKHLLENTKDSLELDKWIILDFNYKNLEGFLLIPKVYAQNWLQKNISKIELKEILEGLSFSKDFEINEIKLKTDIQKEALNTLSPKDFSKLIPEVCNNLLTDSYQKCIYMSGHGGSIREGSEGIIANIFIKDALKLFSVLENKKTQLIYIATCFLGGENLLAVQDSLNKSLNTGLSTSKPSNMIFISGATTQATTSQTPSSFTNFFKAFKTYLGKKENASLKATRKYFADNITNWLTDYSLSAIPQIRFPIRDAKFYSLAPAVIDEITLGTARGVAFKGKEIKPISLEFANQEILVINVPEIDVPIKIKGQIPLFISGIGLRDLTFKDIEIQVQECDFLIFMSKAIKSEFEFTGRMNLFEGIPYTETFTIKKLTLTKETETFDQKGASLGIVHYDTLPSTLSNVSIVRANKMFTAKLKNSKKAEYDTYKFILGPETANSPYLFKIDPRKLLQDNLLNTFNSGNVEQFKATLKTAKSSNYPDIINFSEFNDKTLLGLAAESGKLEMVIALIEAGADAKLQDKYGSTPLHYASRVKLNVVKYLIEKAKASVDKQNNNGWTPLHAAAFSGKLDVVKYLVEDAKANIELTNKDTKTPENLASQQGKKETAAYLASKKKK